MDNFQEGLRAFESKDYQKAFRLLEPIAETGNAEAQCIIANMYQLGMGRNRDIFQAVNWYKKASENGYGVASNNLGGIFLTGDDGIEVDQSEAKEWYSLARKQGFINTPALENLPSLAQRILEAQQKFPKSR
ncbi:MAG: tetratricopeptide repeat protein [Spirulinaceae cyanobacterium]